MSTVAPRYSRKLDEALALAADAFRPRVRKQTEIPYLFHLLQVSVTVAEHGGDEEQLIAALLHDYLEDIDGANAEELEGRFGPRVTRLVLALSDAVASEGEKPPWEGRKRAYLDRVATEPPEVKLICAADKLHNARSIHRDLRSVGEQVWDRFKPSREQTLWYYRELVLRLGQDWNHPLLEELRREVQALHRAAGVDDSGRRSNPPKVKR